MPRFRKYASPYRIRTYPSLFAQAHGEQGSINHRPGGFPRGPGNSKQDTESDTKPGKKQLFRKHIVQPQFDERIKDEDQQRRDERFRLYWRESGVVRNEPAVQSPLERRYEPIRKHTVKAKNDETIEKDRDRRDARFRLNGRKGKKVKNKPVAQSPLKRKDKRFRKHMVQPDINEMAEEDRDSKDAFRLYWRKSGLVKNEPVNHSPLEKKDHGIMQKLLRQQTEPLSPRLRSNSVREPGNASTQNQSRTSQWLSLFMSDGTVVPKQVSRVEYPAGDVANPTPPVPRQRRTNEDRAKVEAVLITSIPSLGNYLSAEMIDMLRTSPFTDPGQDVILLRSHAHRTRGQNALGCFKLLTLLIRNVAHEIVYREQRIAAEEKMYKEEGAYEDPE